MRARLRPQQIDAKERWLYKAQTPMPKATALTISEAGLQETIIGRLIKDRITQTAGAQQATTAITPATTIAAVQGIEAAIHPVTTEVAPVIAIVDLPARQEAVILQAPDLLRPAGHPAVHEVAVAAPPHLDDPNDKLKPQPS